MGVLMIDYTVVCRSCHALKSNCICPAGDYYKSVVSGYAYLVRWKGSRLGVKNDI